MTVRAIDPIADEGWDDFVNSHKDASIYHTSMWCRVLSQTYGFQPRYFVILDDKKIIKAAMPLMIVKKMFGGEKIVGLPFTPYCNPLFAYKDHMNTLIESIIKLQKKIKGSSLEIRFKSDGLNLKKEIRPIGQQVGYTRFEFSQNKNFMTHILDLTSDLVSIKNSFHNSCIKRPIKKAARSDLLLHIANDKSDLKEFYRLQLITRKKHGIPPQPLKYFNIMWDELHNQGHMELLLAISKGDVIAGIILLKYNKTAIYQNGAANNRFIKLHPYHFLLWNAIKTAHKEGYRFFDFGRSSIDEAGLVQFKDRWAASRVQVVYYFYPRISGVTSLSKKNWKYRVPSKIIDWLPLPLFRLIGGASYRYLG